MPAFDVLGDGYRLRIDGVELVLTRVRRQRFELVGELAIVNGAGDTLSEAFNVSDLRARQGLGAHLAAAHRQATTNWAAVLERFCQDVLGAERTGGGAIVLSDHPLPTAETFFDVEGIRLPREHPAIVFGDGGSLKSYLALFAAGKLRQRGLSVLYADWELSADEHRVRLGEIFGEDARPDLLYARCDRPLTSEIDRLRRLRREHAIDYMVFDSVAFACDGPPEAAEVAGRYMQAVRQLGIGTLHLAHTNKSETAHEKPFGSSFWHNGARRTWHSKPVSALGEDDVDDDQPIERVVGLHPRKANIGRMGPSVGFRVTFGGKRAHVARVNLATVPDAAADLPTWQRMLQVLKRGPQTAAWLAKEIEAKVDTIERTARRYDRLFTFVTQPPDHVRRIALLERP